MSDDGVTVQTPGPGSLTITVGATASDSVPHVPPPPDFFAIESLITGIGTARYGSLAGHCLTETSSKPPGPYLAQGTASLNLGFTDVAEVLSDTLDPGTPVTLTFLMTLEGSAVHFSDGLLPDPQGTGAAVRHDVEVRDLDDVTVPSGQAFLVINSRGTHETSRTFEFDTAVGHRLELIANLSVNAIALVDFATHGNTTATAEMLADQTGELFYQPSGDVTLASESLHDYAAPEPARAILLALSAALLLLRSARRATTPPAFRAFVWRPGGRGRSRAGARSRARE